MKPLSSAGAPAAWRICLALGASAGCSRQPPPAPPVPPPPVAAAAQPGRDAAGAPAARPSATPEPARPVARPLAPTRLPVPARLVAVGDLHGDLEAARAALRLAGVIDARDEWSGGATVVVQTGDVLDRGDHERAILDWLHRLADGAAAAGGALHVLNGNHELMNVQGDFRYVTSGGFDAFREFARHAHRLPLPPDLPEAVRARAAAFAPGGPYARRLAEHNTVLVVGDTVFVHGGLLPAHVGFGLEAINREVRAWMLGERRRLPALLEREDSPVWLRTFALQSDPATCELLGQTLERAGVRRMVVGHTVQAGGITSACDGRVWRIDVGLARYYGGPTQVLEIAGGRVRALRAPAQAAAHAPAP